MKTYWRTTTFWTKVSDTLALLGGLATGSIGSLEALTVLTIDPKWLIASAACGLLGTLVRMWMDDQDGDGHVDIFQK
jgi:hypothetical protein